MGTHRPVVAKRRPVPKPSAGTSLARQRWLKRNGVPVTQSRVAAEEDSDAESLPERLQPASPDAAADGAESDGQSASDAAPVEEARLTLAESVEKERRAIVAEWEATKRAVELVSSTMMEVQMSGMLASEGAQGAEPASLRRKKQETPCDYRTIKDAYEEKKVRETAAWFRDMFLHRSGRGGKDRAEERPAETQVYPVGFPSAVDIVLSARDVQRENDEQAERERASDVWVRRAPPALHPLAHLPASAFPQRELVSLGAGYNEGQLTYWTQLDAEPHDCTVLCRHPETGKKRCPPPREYMHLCVHDRDRLAPDDTESIFAWPSRSVTRAGRGAEIPMSQYPPFTFSLSTGQELLPLEMAPALGAEGFSINARADLKLARNISEVSYIGMFGVGVEVVRPHAYIPPAYSLGATRAAVPPREDTPDDLSLHHYDLYGPADEGLVACRSAVVSRNTDGHPDPPLLDHPSRGASRASPFPPGSAAARSASRASLVQQYKHTPHPFRTTQWPRGKDVSHVVVFAARTVEKYKPFPPIVLDDEKDEARERRKQDKKCRKAKAAEDDDDAAPPAQEGLAPQPPTAPDTGRPRRPSSAVPGGKGVVRLTDGTHSVAWPCLSFNSDQLAWVQWDSNVDVSEGSYLYTAPYDTEHTALAAAPYVIDGSVLAAVHSPGFLQSGVLVYLCDAACSSFRLYMTTYDAVDNKHTGTTALLDTGCIRHKVDSGHRVLAVMKYASWHQVAIITSHDCCDSIVLYDTSEKSVVRVGYELAGFGLSRLWDIQSMDESRVAMFASGVATPATIVVYDMRYGHVKSLCDSATSGITRAPPVVSAPIQIGAQSWLYLPPRGVVPVIPPECGEHPVEGRVPIILQPHSGYFDDWQPDVWHADTQFFTSHGFAVVHTYVSGGVRNGRELRAQGLGTWLTRGTEELINSMHLADQVAKVDFHHVAVRGASLDAFLALQSTAAPTSLARVALLSGFTPNLHQWKGEDGSYGFPAPLFSHTDTVSVAALRVPILFHHSRDDVVQPLAEVASFVKLLDCTPTYHGQTRLQVVDGAAHPPRWRTTVEEELEFLTTVQWDPME